MTSLKTLFLLSRVATNYKQQKDTFSSQEITTKIKEIKYLTAQKKIPRLTLRKEIIHLENKLNGIMNLENSLLQQKKQESAKITVLKKQISVLHKKIAISEDKDIQKKIERLSHLLGEMLAKKRCAQDIKLNQDMLQLLQSQSISVPSSVISRKAKREMLKEKLSQSKLPENEKRVSEDAAYEISEEDLYRIKSLYQRLQMLKTELSIHSGLEKDPEKIKVLQEKIKVFEDKLEEFSRKRLSCDLKSLEEGEKVSVSVSEVPQESGEIKHDMIFGMPKIKEVEDEEISDAELEKELPLPPPPRLSR